MQTIPRELIASLPGTPILIVGDVMLDEYVWGEVRRISQEAPVPIVAIRTRTFLAGGAGNAAVNVASLSGVALLGGVVGEDRHGSQVGETLRAHGVAADGLLKDTVRTTTSKTRIIAQNQQMLRVDEEQPTPLTRAMEDQLLHWAQRQMPNVGACILSDYAKGVVTPRFAREFIGLARQAGKPIVVDPKGTDYAKYRGASVIKPNLQEAKRVCKQDSETDTEESVATLGQQLLAMLDGSALLLTRGADGMTLFQRASPPVHIPSMAQAVFDVTGAGDTVAATLALALAVGASEESAAWLANRAAGIVVAKVGTAQATLEELQAAVGGG